MQGRLLTPLLLSGLPAPEGGCATTLNPSWHQLGEPLFVNAGHKEGLQPPPRSPDSSLLTQLSWLAAWKKCCGHHLGREWPRTNSGKGLGVQRCASPRPGSHPWLLSCQHVGRRRDASSMAVPVLGSTSKI